MEDTKIRTVRIEVRNETINYYPHKCHARRGDIIAWKCADGPFAIQFFGVSPIDTVEAQSENNEVNKPVRQEIQVASYPYALAVYANNKVYLDASCPAIIIDYP